MVESGERYSTPVINRSHVTLTTCHYPDIAKKMTDESIAKKVKKVIDKYLSFCYNGYIIIKLLLSIDYYVIV